jgi:hypothetical protein
MFLEGLTTKLNGIYFVRKTLTNDVNSAYWFLLFKNETFSQFNFTILNKFKTVTFFL